MRNARAGHHRELIGHTWYYRRVVPPEVRNVFGVTKVKKSLSTSSETKAKRLEKIHDVEFETKLKAAREAGPDGYSRDPKVRTEQFVGEIYSEVQRDGGFDRFEQLIAQVPKQHREAVIKRIEEYEDEGEGLSAKAEQFWEEELRDLICGLDVLEEWPRTRSEVADLIRDHAKKARTERTLRWAYVKWLETGNRPEQTEDHASGYLDDFQKSARVRMLAAVRRSHLLDWRAQLVARGTAATATTEPRSARKLSAKSINHRLEIVSAILRTGWRDAEMPAPDLSKINLPENNNSGRGAWEKDELLKALGKLAPGSGLAWLFVIGLTTSTRLGETVAAKKKWYNRNGFIEVPSEHTKMKKPHVMPIIELIRQPFTERLRGLNDDQFMFDVPRPNNPKLKISHEASKWFSRFHERYQIPRVIHELRHTWIAAARYDSPVKEEVWEIISGHSKKTVADGYGGQKPLALMAANETICEHLLDADLRAAILRLVA